MINFFFQLIVLSLCFKSQCDGFSSVNFTPFLFFDELQLRHKNCLKTTNPSFVFRLMMQTPKNIFVQLPTVFESLTGIFVRL